MSALLKGFLSLLFVFFWSYFTCGEGTCKEGPKEKTMLWKVTSDAPAFFLEETQNSKLFPTVLRIYKNGYFVVVYHL